MVRQHTNLPFVMDENVNGIDMLLRMYSDKAADVVNLKISKFGGLTKTKQVGQLWGFIAQSITITAPNISDEKKVKNAFTLSQKHYMFSSYM